MAEYNDLIIPMLLHKKKKKSMLLKKPDNQSRSSQISVEVKQAHIKTGSPRDLIKGLQQYFPDVSWEFSFGLIFFFFDHGIPVRSGVYISPAAGFRALY